MAAGAFTSTVPVMGPMIRAASLRGFVPVVRALGGDPDELLRRFEIPAEALGSEDGLISITAHDLMLERAADELACPDLGLRLAQSQDLSVLGPLAVAIESSSTAAQALECASRFMFVHSPALSIGIEADPSGRPGVVALRYRKDLLESPYSAQAIELGVGVFHGVVRGLVGGAVGLRSVMFPHQPLSPIRRYTDFFGVDVRFGAPMAALCVERRMLDAGFASADGSIRRLAIEHLARRHTDPSRLTSLRVRRALAESLGVAAPAVGDVARVLAVHPRTLQRRLAAEGTSFTRVLDDVRSDAAHRYITGTSLPFGQIAALVGFSEQSTLTHAVRRWRGVSPRQLRATSPLGLSR
jgi:AraC-like DNA-binding protein